MPPWNAPKAKVQLRLAVQRLRTLQEKKEAQAKVSRRDIATLLERGKLETARIKVETIINDDIYLELLELMELYSELLIARFGVLDQTSREPDPAVAEGVCSIIYAALRTELKELHILRDLLMHKYGREFSQAVMENRDNCVSERVAKKLVVHTPAPELVDAYLTEIARGYGVPWTPPGRDDDASSADDDHGPTGGAKETTDESVPAEKAAAVPESDVATAPPVKVIDKRLENKFDSPPSVVKLPDPPGAKTSNAAAKDDFDTLRQRFEALKKK